MSEFEIPRFQSKSNVMIGIYGTDDDAFVEFYDKPVMLESESSKSGHPIYVNQVYVKIQFPGDKTKIIDRPKTDEDGYRWPNALARYERKQTIADEGWRLDDWAVLTRADVENLKVHGIYTVEQLALVTDSNVINIGLGMRNFKDKAIAALKQARDGSAVTQLESVNAQLQAQINALKAQIDDIAKIDKGKKAA